jgi:hypothetical protein
MRKRSPVRLCLCRVVKTQTEREERREREREDRERGEEEARERALGGGLTARPRH